MTTPTYPFSLDLNYIDLAAMDRQTLNSSAFKFWVNWKILHEGVIFSSDEAALSEYMLELAYGFPLSAFMREPNDLGSHSLPAFESPLPALFHSLSLTPSDSTSPSSTFSTPETPIERWKAIQQAPWRLANQLEPLDHNRRPILMDWMMDTSPPDSREHTWTCQVPSTVDNTQPCGEIFPRWDRGLTHIRSKHLNLRPFLCGGGGDCRTPNCKMGFASKENLYQHQYPKRTNCQWCGKEELRQNLKRHHAKCPSRTGQALHSP